MFSVEALGHGNAVRLISLAQAQADSMPQKVLSAAALAACSGSTYANNAGRALGTPSAAEDARKCLLKAPMLSELHEWSSWHLLFELELGSLSSFLQDQGQAASGFCYLAEVPIEQLCHKLVSYLGVGCHHSMMTSFTCDYVPAWRTSEDQTAHHEQRICLYVL